MIQPGLLLVDAPLRAGIPSVLTFGLAAILVLINWIVVKAVIERIRWRRAGKRGFDAFLAAGAPLTHDKLVGAFSAPGTFSHRGEHARVVPLGSLRLPTGRLALVVPRHIAFTDDVESLDVTLPSDRALTVEGLALGDDPSVGFAALRIVVGEDALLSSGQLSLEPAFTHDWRDARATSERRLPSFGVGNTDDVVLGSVEGLEDLRAREKDDETVWDDLKLEAPKKFASRGDLPPLSRLVAAGTDAEPVLVARSWLYEEVARPLLQRDESGAIVAVLVDLGALGEPRWNWTPGR